MEGGCNFDVGYALLYLKIYNVMIPFALKMHAKYLRHLDHHWGDFKDQIGETKKA